MSLASLGRPSLIAAFVFAIAAATLCAYGAVKRKPGIAWAGARSLTVAAGFVALATVSLMTAFFGHDFSLAYVAAHSSRSLSGPYMFTALWSGMEGSLLLWALLLTVFSSIALRQAIHKNPRLVPWAGAVLGGVSIFFLALLVIPANPFIRSAPIPADGLGLNTFLQSPGMLIHPPLLYTGFVGFSIPFAFAMAALFTGRLDEAWFTTTRRWTLFAWSALSIGIVIGGAWAYTELGWGGYWAWDPVENASFIPWLTATAFLHSVVIQEKRRMLKVWNVALILLTYVLSIFGTFLTRSGILSSIHTFSEGPIGKWFLPFLALMLIGGLAVVAWRADALRSENRFDSLLSRESAFLLNNVLFVAAAFTILWGTIYPIIAEALTGTRLSVGPPFFDSVFIPIGLAIVLMTGIGPLISWRRMSKGSFTRVVRYPLLAGGATIVVLALFRVRSLGALLAFSLCAFTATAIVGEFVRGSRIYRNRHGLAWGPAFVRTVLRNRRRYGGYVVHLGVLLIVIGLAGQAFRTERQAVMQTGDKLSVGNYVLTYEGRTQSETAEKQVNTATIDVTRGGKHITTMHPQRNFHFAQQQPQSEVAIRTTPLEDLYVVVTSFD
ncbi:MAG: cytochrome c-type biosis protein CcmF, partial [Actinomycetota bacterium]|nr:cytochrome c-type biosis protein CcmF [Actinomycetota bacterium]